MKIGRFGLYGNTICLYIIGFLDSFILTTHQIHANKNDSNKNKKMIMKCTTQKYLQMVNSKRFIHQIAFLITQVLLSTPQFRNQ